MAGVSTKDIKLRIRSMENTKQITKAMEMVAASKLRRAQDRVLKSRPYFEVLYQGLLELASANREYSSRFVRPAESDKTCYIVIAGDRGLAGGYNHNVLKLAASQIKNKKESYVLPVGKKALEYFRANGYNILTDAYAEASVLSISKCFTMSRQVCKDFMAAKFDRVRLVYTNYVSIMTQNPATMSVLPAHFLTTSGITPSREGGEFLYEPDSEAIFNTMIPECMGGLIYGALCESLASELSARRTAMDAATKNAEEMIDDLNLKYNRARQSAITQEITEIVAGADA